jgi:diguanylate cyclase (GGDEF)-like protein
VQGCGSISRILTLQNELNHAREELRVQSMRDGLTRLWNRTAFLGLLTRELTRTERTDGESGLLLLDLDHFKPINDTYGHPVGDLVLKEIARRLRHHVRSYDFVRRYGGEEFFIAFPGSGSELLRHRAEAIRKAISSAPIRVPQGDLPIAGSIIALHAAAGERSASEMVVVADVGLYEAKDSGRNRAVFCDKAWSEMAEGALTNRDRCSQCDAAKSAACLIATN